MRILFTGDGTGGRLMPIIAVAEKVKELLSDFHQMPIFLFIGSESLLNEVVVNFGISVKTINSYKTRKHQFVKNITELVNLPIGFIQAFFYVYSFMPDVVFSKGGYSSFPVVLAAWILRIPIIIHESGSVAGIADILTGKMADRVAISYAETENYFAKKKIIFTGNPVRQELLSGNRERALEEFNLNRELPTVLILGGSQGAQKINDIVLQVLPKIVDKVQIIHQCGINNFEEIKKQAIDLGIESLSNYHLYPFLYKNLNDAYASCDIIVSRAGANNIAEIINLGKPMILIPLSSLTDNHQLKNAYYFSKRGAALILDETNLTPNMLYDAIFGILENKTRQMQMMRSARALAKPAAARAIAEEIIRLGK